MSKQHDELKDLRHRLITNAAEPVVKKANWLRLLFWVVVAALLLWYCGDIMWRINMDAR